MFIGITTAPRSPPTIRHTVRSVRACGYEPIVFAEPYSHKSGAKTIVNSTRIGIWDNWIGLCAYGIESGHEIIVSLQDDIDLHPDTLSFTEKYAKNIKGVLSLYSSSHYSFPPGVHHIPTKYLWGACALAFRVDTLISILEHPRARNWPRSTGQDIAIGNVVNDMKLPIHFIFPSPVAHIAQTSSVGHGGNDGVRNCIKQADRHIPLEEQVWPS